MKRQGLVFQYDARGDILYIEKRPSYPEQDSEDIGEGVVARLNPGTGEVESLEVLFFSDRLAKMRMLELPITAEFKLWPKDAGDHD